MTTATTTQGKAAARARVARYRQAHPMRLDYVPAANVARLIAGWANACTLDGTIAGTLDRLVLAGDEWLRAKAAISGNQR